MCHKLLEFFHPGSAVCHPSIHETSTNISTKRTHLVCGWYASSLRSVRVTYNYFPQTTDCKEPCSVSNLRTMYRVPDQLMYDNGPDLRMFGYIVRMYVRHTFVCMPGYWRLVDTRPVIQRFRLKTSCTSLSVSASLLTSISKMKSMTPVLLASIHCVA